MVDILPTVRNHPFDPPAELEEFRQNQPLRPLAYPDGHVGWLVTSYALGRAVLADPRFSARMELKRYPVQRQEIEGFSVGEAGPGFFIDMDPPKHTRYRRLLTGQFTVRRMNLLKPRIEQIVNDHLDAMEQAGPPLDLVEAFALPIPSLVICELLGVPYADRKEFQRNTAILNRLEAGADQSSAAMRSIMVFLVELIHGKRTKPADDLISGLLNSGELTDEEVAGISELLLNAGHETTANMFSLGTFALLLHPEQTQSLRDGEALIDSAVEELLRYLTILQFGLQRTALEDVAVDGQQIKAGECVTISLPAANRDPERFDDPDQLDLSRAASGQLAFGHGIHQCIGQQLARIEMRIGYAALFRRFPTLRLAVPANEVSLRDDMVIYGVQQLPVAW